MRLNGQRLGDTVGFVCLGAGQCPALQLGGSGIGVLYLLSVFFILASFDAFLDFRLLGRIRSWFGEKT